MTITEENIRCIEPTAKNLSTYVPLLNRYMEEMGINTPMRVAHFIAQVLVESACFSAVVENLNYSEQGLLKVFPKYFNSATAKSYARNQRMIANKVYANRMGNGNEASGDGYKYRGRGLIQITGKAMYQKYMGYCKYDVVKDPDLLMKPLGAVRSACWFWQSHGLNAIADTDNLEKVTKTINGGTHGIDKRRMYTLRAKAVFGA